MTSKSLGMALSTCRLLGFKARPVEVKGQGGATAIKLGAVKVGTQKLGIVKPPSGRA